MQNIVKHEDDAKRKRTRKRVFWLDKKKGREPFFKKLIVWHSKWKTNLKINKYKGKVINSYFRCLSCAYCQRASRAKTRGWRGGSIIEPCESTV